MGRRNFRVLLIEDDEGDIELTQEALASSGLPAQLQAVRDGVEALAYLRQEGSFADAVQPDLILLDLNMPRKGGIEVLQDLRSDDKLKHIPVAVLTTSDAREDILKAYSAGANCYISKPVSLDEFLQVVQELKHFWLNVVELPS